MCQNVIIYGPSYVDTYMIIYVLLIYDCKYMIIYVYPYMSAIIYVQSYVCRSQVYDLHAYDQVYD